jgi:hypothetical protein
MSMRLLAPFAFLLTLLPVSLHRPAEAATLTVTDCGDTTPGGSSGQLRKLINDAASGDTIVVPACTITLTGAAVDNANQTGDLDVNKSLTIQGAGASSTIIDGSALDRVFDINPLGTPSVVVTLTGLTIRNGKAASESGGGLRISNAASVTLRDSVVTANTTDVVGGGIRGEIATSLTLVRTTVSNNTATVFGGGAAGIDTVGFLTVTNSTISGNTSSGTGNPLAAGGIAYGGLSLTVTGSTISGNSVAAADSGAGILLTGANSSTLTNTTISGNSNLGLAPGAGAVMHRSSGQLTVTNSTLVGNTALGAAGNGGLVVRATGDFRLKNTIVASNTPENCSILSTGTILSHEPNLDSGNTCVLSAAAGDLVNTDPKLGPLQNNGGPTLTHAPLTGSPVIDVGTNAGCPATDQRGVLRPLDTTHPGLSVCDLGAVEVDTLGFITASLALDTATVHPGTPLQGTATVSNTGEARPLDVYVFLLAPAAAGPALGCPGGDAVAFLTTGAAVVTCVSSGVQTFRPLFGNVTLAGSLFTPLTVPIFSLAWPAAPTGGWLAGIALTPVGAFSDGRVNPLGTLVLATAAFTALP